MAISPKFRKKTSSPILRRTKGRKWRRFREAFFAADPLNRLCAECRRFGRTTAAVIADHIIPVSVCPGREFDATNLQGLCQFHSDQKTAAENRGER